MAKLHVDLDEVGVTESYSDLGNIKLTSIEKRKLILCNQVQWWKVLLS